MSRFTGSRAGQTIRVVLFYGPFLRSAREFAVRLDAHPKIELAAVFCCAEGDSPADEFRNVWRRRGALALPLFTRRQVRRLSRYMLHPQAEWEFQRGWRAVQSRLKYAADIHADSVLQEVRELAPDLALSYGSPILRPSLFRLPSHGTLGIHHGRLPDYRGRKTTFWEVWEGEPTAGVTIQRINEGVDTGEIVAAAGVEIGTRSYERIWNDVQRCGIDLFVEAVLAVGDRTATYTVPSGEPGPLRRDPTPVQLLRLPIQRLLQRLGVGR